MYKPAIFQTLRLFIVIFTILGLYFTIKYTFTYIYPFLIALLVSFLINPVVTFIVEKLKVPRPFATLIVLSGFMTFFFTSFALIITELIRSTTDLAEKIPVYFQNVITFLDDMFHTSILPFYHKIMSFFSTLNPSQQEAIDHNIQELSNHIASSGASLLKDILLFIPEFITALPQSLTTFIIIVIATFLITNDWDRIMEWIQNKLPSKIDRASKEMLNHLKRSLFGFLKAQSTLVLISGLIIYIGLLLLDINHAITITLFAIMSDLLPLVGTGLIFIPWIIYLFLTAHYSLTIGLTILYMVTIVARQILEPKILSNHMGLNPLLALITLFISIQLWGVTGIVLTPFIMIILSAAYRTGITAFIWKFIKG